MSLWGGPTPRKSRHLSVQGLTAFLHFHHDAEIYFESPHVSTTTCPESAPLGGEPGANARAPLISLALWWGRTLVCGGSAAAILVLWSLVCTPTLITPVSDIGLAWGGWTCLTVGLRLTLGVRLTVCLLLIVSLRGVGLRLGGCRVVLDEFSWRRLAGFGLNRSIQALYVSFSCLLENP